MKTKIILGIVLLFAVLQLFNPDKVVYSEVNENDIFLIEQQAENIELVMKKACYDCHSNQIKYPWYSSIAPISFWIQDHINHAREHLNFSNWGNYSSNKKAHKAEEAYEEIGEDEMPLPSYVLGHQEANLTEEEKMTLINWFKSIERKYER